MVVAIDNESNGSLCDSDICRGKKEKLLKGLNREKKEKKY